MPDDDTTPGAAANRQRPLTRQESKPATVVRYALAAVFVVFALIQLNDPDPALWVVAYVLVALAIAAPPASAATTRLAWLAGGVLLALGLAAAPGFLALVTGGELSSLAAEMSPDRPNVEPAREFLGAVIAGGALVGTRMAAARRAGSPLHER